MIQLGQKLENTSGQTLSYVSEELARVKIDIAADGTVTVSVISDTERDRSFLLTASASSGLKIKTS